MTVKIHVVYCGGWGYKPKVNKLHQQLIDEFSAEEIDFSMEATKGVSGWLEVSVNGQLVHSKKNGDGYSAAKLNKIMSAVRKEIVG